MSYGKTILERMKLLPVLNVIMIKSEDYAILRKNLFDAWHLQFRGIPIAIHYNYLEHHIQMRYLQVD